MPDLVYMLRCRTCGHKWKKRVREGTPLDPKCPNLACGEENQARGYDPAGKPIAIGGSMRAKVIDDVAEMVMEDYKLTNLQDTQREGDIAAPKLPPHQQVQVDSFFGARNASAQPAGVVNPQTGQRIRLRTPLPQLAAAALGGSFAPGVAPGAVDSVAIAHQNKQVVQPNFVAGDGIGGKAPPNQGG